jgi:hypothetical protein
LLQTGDTRNMCLWQHDYSAHFQCVFYVTLGDRDSCLKQLRWAILRLNVTFAITDSGSACGDAENTLSTSGSSFQAVIQISLT